VIFPQTVPSDIGMVSVGEYREGTTSVVPHVLALQPGFLRDSLI